jgi:GDP-L-fucose synthase
MIHKTDKIFVAGHRGLVGSAIIRRLRAEGFDNLTLRTRQELDLMNHDQVAAFFAREKPDLVFLAAAKVGGILANESLPADFIRNNMQIQLNVVEAAYRSGVRKLQFLGSSCIYPRLAPQPIQEAALLTGPLEPTNQWYAIAKISGVLLCQAYAKQYGFRATSLMPTNLYGPGDNFHPAHSHVLPALMRRFHEAKQKRLPEVVVWGTGKAYREFLFVDDLADAAVFLMQNYDDPEIINVGSGRELTIRELAELLKEVVGYQGTVRFDATKPDGTPRKLLDVTRLQDLGWEPRVSLHEGLAITYQWLLDNHAELRGVPTTAEPVRDLKPRPHFGLDVAVGLPPVAQTERREIIRD